MTIYRYVSPSRVARIEERFSRVHKSGFGDAEATERVSTGWWVTTDGPSPISMQAGPERPPFEVGAECAVIVEVKSGGEK